MFFTSTTNESSYILDSRSIVKTGFDYGTNKQIKVRVIRAYILPVAKFGDVNLDQFTTTKEEYLGLRTELLYKDSKNKVDQRGEKC